MAWGTQNRETPLRKIAGSQWEIKCMDGIANAYLALAAVVTAGVREGEAGLRREVPAGMTEDEQAALGIRARIPRTLGGALEALCTNISRILCQST
jgi:glutamine synthetase